MDAVSKAYTRLQQGSCARQATRAHMVSGCKGTSFDVRERKSSMVHEGRGVAAKHTEDGDEVCGHGAAAADALRERGEQPSP